MQFLDELPSTSTGTKRSRQSNVNKKWTNDLVVNFQKNFINKYSLLFVEKEELKVKIDQLNGVIEEQKQTIAKLITNSQKQQADRETQTQYPIIIDAETQVEPDDVAILTDERNIVDRAVQCDLLCVETANEELMSPQFSPHPSISHQTNEDTQAVQQSIVVKVIDDTRNTPTATPTSPNQAAQNNQHSIAPASTNPDTSTEQRSTMPNTEAIAPASNSETSIEQRPSTPNDQHSIYDEGDTLPITATIAPASNPETSIELPSAYLSGLLQKGPPYECKCGRIMTIKSRIITHLEKGRCKSQRNERKAPMIPCPVCKKQFVFDGLKSHLNPFTKPSSRSTYNRYHAMVSVERHKKIFAEVVEQFGPKKRHLPLN